MIQITVVAEESRPAESIRVTPFLLVDGFSVALARGPMWYSCVLSLQSIHFQGSISKQVEGQGPVETYWALSRNTQPDVLVVLNFRGAEVSTVPDHISSRLVRLIRRQNWSDNESWHVRIRHCQSRDQKLCFSTQNFEQDSGCYKLMITAAATGVRPFLHASEEDEDGYREEGPDFSNCGCVSVVLASYFSCSKAS